MNKEIACGVTASPDAQMKHIAPGMWFSAWCCQNEIGDLVTNNLSCDLN